MRRNYSVMFLFILFILSNFLLFFYFPDHEYIFLLILILANPILLFYTRPMWGLGLVVAQVLGMGFLYTGLAAASQWDNAQQLQGVIRHSLLIFHIVVTWLLMISWKKLLDQLKKNQEDIALLKKYDNNTPNLLTQQEFLYRLKSLHAAMIRKNEDGLFILISLDTKSYAYGSSAIFDICAKTLLDSVRANYDLIGKISDTQLIICLQNPSSQGKEIVIGRFLEKLQDKIQLPENFYRIQQYPLPKVWEEISSFFQNTICERGDLPV